MILDIYTTMMAVTFMLSMGVVGVLCNFVAMLVIIRNTLLHNTFGYLCFSHLVSNIGILLCFTTWPVVMILMQDNELAHSYVGKQFGQFTIFFWYTCIFAHVSISINRFVCIVFPVTSMIWFTTRNTKFAIFVIWCLAFVTTIPYFYYETCYVAFNAHTMQWTYGETECGQNLSNFDFIAGVILCSIAFVIDMCTLIRLRAANNIMNCNAATITEMMKRRKNEVRLFAQAFTQCMVFCLTVICFHVFAILSDNLWWQFSMVTMIWIGAHSLDGLIVVLFHFRFSMFKNQKISVLSFTAVSSKLTTASRQF